MTSLLTSGTSARGRSRPPGGTGRSREDLAQDLLVGGGGRAGGEVDAAGGGDRRQAAAGGAGRDRLARRGAGPEPEVDPGDDLGADQRPAARLRRRGRRGAGGGPGPVAAAGVRCPASEPAPNARLTPIATVVCEIPQPKPGLAGAPSPYTGASPGRRPPTSCAAAGAAARRASARREKAGRGMARSFRWAVRPGPALRRGRRSVPLTGRP